MPKKPEKPTRGKKPTPDNTVKAWTEFLTLRMEHMHSYHDHKENMAHAALLLNLGFVGAMVSSNEPTPGWIGNDLCCRILAMFAVLSIWFLIHSYMRWQLRNRRIAANYYNAFLRVLRHWAAHPPSAISVHGEPPKYEPRPEEIPFLGQSESAAKVSWIDRHIFPRETGPIFGDEGSRGYPTVIVSTIEAVRTGAIKAERLVSGGGILLGVLLLVRLIVAEPTGALGGVALLAVLLLLLTVVGRE